MGLKILHSADWHLGAPFASFSEEQRQLLVREQRMLPEKIASLVRQEKCDLVLLAGDLFDTAAPSRDWVQLLKCALAEMAVPVFLSPGNHDSCAPGSPWLEEIWPENVHIFTGKIESVVIPQLNCRIYGAGFQSMDCPSLLEGFQAEGNEQYCIAVLHGDPVVRQSPCNPVTTQQVQNSGLDYLALGHIHRAGAFRAGSTLCAWPGCPMGRGWDETGEKGVLLVTLGETADVMPLSLDTLRFFDLEVDEEENLETMLPPAGSRDFYRITLTGCGERDLTEIRESLSRFPNLTLRDHREEKTDLWADVGEDTLRGVYFAMLQEQNASLTAEISQKLLSGREVRLP